MIRRSRLQLVHSLGRAEDGFVRRSDATAPGQVEKSRGRAYPLIAAIGASMEASTKSKRSGRWGTRSPLARLRAPPICMIVRSAPAVNAFYPARYDPAPGCRVAVDLAERLGDSV